MRLAICIDCGQAKKTPLAKCSSCGLDPKGDDIASAKSIRLSTKYWMEDEERNPSKEELEEISKMLKADDVYEYKEEEIEALIKEKRLLDQGISIFDKLKIIGLILFFFALGIIGLLVFIFKN